MIERRDPIELFRAATGFEPYEYQRSLAARATPPEVIEVPTGAGKTFAALIPWLADPGAPRRLVYALPMRSLVEQTASVVRAALARVGAAEAVPVHTLMGGVEVADWRGYPDQRMVLVGTIDMLLSRALNRGYGESRFTWPVSFGLLNSDCRWVFDEVQLMGPARTTSAQLAGLRRKLGTALAAETIWMSATVDLEALETVDHRLRGDVVRLSAEDRRGALAKRLNAVKTVTRVDLSAVKAGDLGKRIAEVAVECHQLGERTLVVVNRVETAQAIHGVLAKRRGDRLPALVLVHSRYRPPDRAARMAEALAAPGPNGTIVVATQVVEAGIDMSSACLITETAPFSSMVQRFGRCNRAGELAEASVVWLDRGSLDVKAAAPYDPADLAAAGEAFAGLVGRSASPACLEQLRVPETRPVDAVLRRVDLLDLFDTAPDLSGADVDIAPFVREDDERNAFVFFRAVELDQRRLTDQSSPHRDELVSVPRDAVTKRARWVFDHVDGEWVRLRDNDRIAAGSTVLLAISDGGYDAQLGWTGNKKHVPEPLPPSGREAESIGSDDGSSVGRWVALDRHLADAEREASRLVEDLPAELADAVCAAAAMHDIGKAHPAFQEMLLNTIADEDARRQRKTSGVWAKSANSGGKHVRPYFRHELASALALDGSTLRRYLVAAHHGRVRMSIRPAPGERHPAGESTRFALGVCDGDRLPQVQTARGVIPARTLDLSEMELGGGWTAAAAALLEELGPFRLAYLEALVRIADWRASA
ncbi:MAG TPA: CRISPR-associated helicase Cas3' [Solirubrobacter sp.]|nr:CRISPR-associated helicase Cas3' [Solirubrobacter sp.]